MLFHSLDALMLTNTCTEAMGYTGGNLSQVSPHKRE